MTSPRNIAPARPPPIPTSTAPSTTQPDPPSQAVGANDVIFVNGQPFNGRGYPVCGVANQRGRLCGRIGTCPFHARQKAAATPKRPRSPNQPSHPSPHTTDAKRNRAALNVRQMAMPPQKSRFKRSWTTEEHRVFLQAMRRYGKGKWKEIASEVKTRTANQCQSHAQKYFLRQAKSDSERKKKSIHDVTETDVLDTTWNSLQTAARQALAGQQQQQPQQSKQQQQQQPQQREQQKPPSAQTIAPAPLSTSAKPSTSAPQTSSTLAITVSLPPTSTPVTSAKGLSFATSAPLTTVTQAPETKKEATQTTGIPTVNIAIPASCSQSPSLTSPHSSITSAALPIVQNRSGVPTVPVVVPMPGVGIQYSPMVSPFLHPAINNPSSAAIVAPPPPTKLRVTVHVNGRLKGGMALMLPSGWDRFFEMAKSKLQFEGTFKRVFTRSGGEITSLDEMCQDDMLWLSTGEDFLTPR